MRQQYLFLTEIKSQVHIVKTVTEYYKKISNIEVIVHFTTTDYSNPGVNKNLINCISQKILKSSMALLRLRIIYDNFIAT